MIILPGLKLQSEDETIDILSVDYQSLSLNGRARVTWKASWMLPTTHSMPGNDVEVQDWIDSGWEVVR
jgi:hypothetical protein